MELVDFEEHLKKQMLTTEQVNAALSIVKKFGVFLSKDERAVENVNHEDLHNFSIQLIENEENTYVNYVGLLKYAYYIKNSLLIQAVMEILDGREVIENFSRKLTDEFGIKIRNEIFQDIDIPPLGLDQKKKPEITRKLVERFLEKSGYKECEEFLAKGLRNKYEEDYAPARERFLKTKNIDEFLRDSHENLIETLKKHQKEGTLFFTQEIDDDVISYVRQNPTIEGGIRRGNQVIITKIPYMAKQYLNEPDEHKRKYYYCHCPWAREALKEEEGLFVPPVFCNCSAGYYKNYWEAVLEQPVKVELLESVLKGDDVCKFALHLPEEFIL